MNELNSIRINGVNYNVGAGVTIDQQYDPSSTNAQSGAAVASAIGGKVDKTTTINGHALSSNVAITKSDIGLENVANTGDSAVPVLGGTTKFTTGGAYTELAKKADKTEVYTKTEGQALETSVNSALNTQQTKIDALDSHEIIVGALPSTGVAGKIYRVPDDPATGQYTDYGYNADALTTPVKIATYQMPGIDSTPTKDSNGLVTSGGVFNEVFPVVATINDVAYLNATDDITPIDFQADDINNFRFSLNYKAPYDGRVSKLMVTAAINSWASYSKAITVIQLRPNENETSYTEVARATIYAFTGNTYEYPVGFDVKKGDIFGYSGRVVQKYITGQQTKSVSFSDNSISFNVSELTGYTFRHPCVVPVLTPYKNEEMFIERKDDVEIKKNNLIEGLVMRDRLINDSGNIFTSANTQSVVFPADENTTYMIYHQNGEWYDHALHSVFFFDANMSIINVVRANNLAAYDETHRYILTPAGTKFVGYNIKYASVFDYSENLIIQEGTSPSDASKYNISSINNKKILNRYPEFSYDVPLNTYILGDSIAVNGYSKWHDYILNKFSFKNFISVAQGGASWAIRNDANYSSISSATWDSGSADAAENVIARQVYRMIDGVENHQLPTPELVFIHCGTNDCSYMIYDNMKHGREIGDADTVFNFDDSEYTQWSGMTIDDPHLLQMVGAIRFCIEMIWRKWPLCKIVITTPIQRSRVEGESAVTPLREVRKQILKCGEYMSVPVLDMYQEASIYTPMESIFLSDGLHPNNTHGGKRFADVIGRYLTRMFGFKNWY